MDPNERQAVVLQERSIADAHRISQLELENNRLKSDLSDYRMAVVIGVGLFGLLLGVVLVLNSWLLDARGLTQ